MINQLLGQLTTYLKKKVFRHPLIAKVAKYLLSASWFTENSVYSSIYHNKIISDIEKGKPFPQIVQIELTNRCNADCIMCPRRLMKRPKGTMQFSLYKKIINECTKYNPEIMLTGYGESLLDKQFPAKLAYTRQVFPGKIYLFTNGSLLNEAVSTALIENKINSVSFSLDSSQPEQYEKIRRGLYLEKVIQNIKGLIDKKKKLHSSYPRIVVTMIKMEENKNNIKQFKEYFQDKVDAVYFQSLKNWGGTLKETKSDFHFQIDYRKRVPCHYLWKNMVILWNGDVALCCQDFDGQVILGNTKKSSLQEIWSGAALAEYRTAHLEKRFDKVSICADCSFHSVWW